MERSTPYAMGDCTHMSQHMDGTNKSGRGTVVAIVLIVIAILVIAYFAWWVPIKHG